MIPIDSIAFYRRLLKNADPGAPSWPEPASDFHPISTRWWVCMWRSVGHRHGVVRGAGISNLVPSIERVRARFRGRPKAPVKKSPPCLLGFWVTPHLQSSFLLMRKLGIGKGAVMLWKENRSGSKQVLVGQSLGATIWLEGMLCARLETVVAHGFSLGCMLIWSC